MGWRQSVITASLIIVYGTGANTGLFVYNGTPAHGNPPIFWASSATSDPFGNALPNNATAGVAGTGTFSAGNTIINASGSFTYSSAPALGNLIASTASVGGFDTPGNEYLAGNVGYTFIGAEPAYYAVQVSSNGIAIFRATAATGPYTQMGGVAYEHGGFAGVQLYDQASGASLTVGDSVDGAGNVFGALAGVLSLYPATGTPTPTPAGNALVYANANGTPSGQTGNGQAGALPVIQTDSTSHPQTNVVTPSIGNVSAAWTIQAKDAQVGTIYEVELPFTSVFEGIQLNIGVNFAGTFTNVVPVAAAAFTAGHSLVGTVRLKLTCTTSGASGAFNVDIDGTANDSGTARTPATSITLNGHTSLSSIDTTAAHAFAVAVNWASTNASQSFTGLGSKYTRGGP